jgi:hypothetical protein
MQNVAQQPWTALVDEWFKAFGRALSGANAADLARLFHPTNGD